ncbi:hypothetical protein J11TS1_25950 [Oceanobacillus sp. J11TS1]|nr:hypothetical protein J11TS1_25950 [Oceanobacillus sp. J11TS1]
MTLMMRFGTMYNQGDIVLIPVPFSDLKQKNNVLGSFIYRNEIRNCLDKDV